jgi:hypothetical protein
VVLKTPAGVGLAVAPFILCRLTVGPLALAKQRDLSRRAAYIPHAIQARSPAAGSNADVYRDRGNYARGWNRRQ